MPCAVVYESGQAGFVNTANHLIASAMLPFTVITSSHEMPAEKPNEPIWHGRVHGATHINTLKHMPVTHRQVNRVHFLTREPNDGNGTLGGVKTFSILSDTHGQAEPRLTL